MDKVSVKAADINLRAADNVKAGSQIQDTSGEFKKLLQNQKDDSSEVSKDTKTERKPEASKDSKEEQVKEEPGKDDKTEVKSVQVEGLLAAYQLSQNMKPEMVKVEQEPAVEEIVPAVQMDAGEELAVQEMPEEAVVDVQVSAKEQVKAPQAENVFMNKEEVSVEKSVEAPKEMVKTEAVPEQKQSENTGKEDADTAGSRMAEQTVQIQNPETVVKTEVPETKLQEPVRMQVPQPEELPEKVTDQIVSKMSEGIQEFEIHIEPANLGKIAVKILYQEGQATVSILCSEKKTFEMMGRNAGELGQVIEKNLGGTTTIIVDKQEADYLNQSRDDNQKDSQNGGQEQQKGSRDNQDAEDAEQFLQKLRLGLAG